MLTTDSIVYCNNRLRWFFWTCGYSGKASIEIPKRSRTFWYFHNWKNENSSQLKDGSPAWSVGGTFVNADSYVRQDKLFKAKDPALYKNPLHFFCPKCGKEMRDVNETVSRISRLNLTLLSLCKLLVIFGLGLFIFYITKGSERGMYSDYDYFLYFSFTSLIIGMVGSTYIGNLSSVSSK